MLQDEPKGALTLIVNSFIEFFKQIHSFLKFLFFILFCCSIWLLNDSMGFIRDFRISNKIENVKEIETIINNPKIDTTTKKMLQSLEHQIIQRESLLERLYLFFDETQYSDKTVSANAGTEQKPITTSTSLNNGFISLNIKPFLHIFSSSWIAVILFFYCIYWIIKDRKTNIKAPFIVIAFSLLNILLFSIITLIFPKSNIEVINYLINALFYTTSQLILGLILLPKILEQKEQIVSILAIKE